MKVLIISNHHRRSCFFEETMRILDAKGYSDIVIQETGVSAWGEYRGPGKILNPRRPCSFDQGMVNFKQNLGSLSDRYDIVVLVDNDLFFKDILQFNQYLQDFQEAKFDYTCHFVSEKMYKKPRQKIGSICIVDDITFRRTETPPYVVSEPHFENAYQLIRTSLWDRLTAEDFSHGRKMVKAVYDTGAKIGGH